MKAWGLDQPIPIQYCRWMGFCDPDGEGFDFIGPTGWPNFLPTAISGSTNGILHGDLGYSITSGEKVNDRSSGRPCRRSSSPASRWSSGSASRS